MIQFVTLSPPAAPPPVDLFVAGVAVTIRVADWDAGDVRLDGTVVRRLSESHVKVRLADGRAVAVYQGDLCLRRVA